jgi:hypothetical protein
MIAILRRPKELVGGDLFAAPDRSPFALLPQFVGWIVVCGLAYGAVMGTFGGIWGDRLYQVLYSALKVPLLVVVTFVLSLPTFFVFNSLLGVRSDFGVALRALVLSQAGLTVILLFLAPYTVFWYASFADYQSAILFNAFLFAVASAGGQVILWRGYRPLIARRPVHRWLLGIWLLLYAFVGIQMGWVLRPFIGDPARPVEFFRADTWGNAYVIVGRMIWNALTR